MYDGYTPFYVGGLAREKQEKAAALIEGAEDQVDEVNRQYAVIGNWNGRCCILDEGPPARRMSFADFKRWLANQFVKVPERISSGGMYAVSVPLAKFWLNHPRRRQYASVTLKPNDQGGTTAHYTEETI